MLLPGDTFSFSGYSAPDDDVGGNAGKIWAGNAIVDQLVVNWNWSTGEIINMGINFSGNGALAVSDGTHSDATDPDVPIPCGTKITYGDPLVLETEWDNLVSAVLTITAENQAYVNSSSVISGECWTQRKPGNIDWTLAVTEQNNEGLATEIDIAADEEFRLYVDDTDFWLLKWGHVGDVSGLTVDRETGAIMQRTVNIAMNGFNPDVGEITLPGAGSSWWPFTG